MLLSQVAQPEISQLYWQEAPLSAMTVPPEHILQIVSLLHVAQFVIEQMGSHFPSTTLYPSSQAAHVVAESQTVHLLTPQLGWQVLALADNWKKLWHYLHLVPVKHFTQY